MKFKKAITFLLCAVMSVSMLACGTIDMPNGGLDNPNGVVTSGKTYTITFDGNGAEHNPDPMQVGAGDTMGAKIPVPTRAGFIFVGWFDANNNKYIATTPITGNVVLTARWESNAAKLEYEKNISSWAKPGHLYIHYKRGAHLEGEQITPPSAGVGSGAPTYNTASQSSVYGDWGLWCWPKNGEGRTFNLAWIDESGAVYDVDLTQEYHDAGWNGDVVPGVALNNDMDYKSVDDIGFQLFKISSRQEQGYWKNDGDNNYVKLSNIQRAAGDAHWFVTEMDVPHGTKEFVSVEIEDVYGKIPAGSAITRISGKDVIDSTKPSTYPKWDKAVTNSKTGNDKFDANTGYQIFIASFADGIQDDADTPLGQGMGDLKGIIDKLDYIQNDVGADILWLTPFQQSTNYHGYDINDYFSVDTRWGTDKDYKDLVDEVHKRGMKIVMDFVLNHTSGANEWFVKSKKLVKEQNVKFADTTFDEVDYRQFYNWINEDQYQKLSADAKKQWFGDEHGYYFYSSFSSSQPELNYDYQPVRDAIVDVCYKWMEYGLDGFRLDAVKHIYMVNEVVGKGGTCSAPISDNDVTNGVSGVVADGLYSHDQNRNYNFYREFNYKLKSKYPNAFVVGENLDGWNARTDDYYQGIDSQFDFNVYYGSRGFAEIRGIDKIDKQGNPAGGEKPNANWMSGAFTPALEGYNMFKKVNPNFIGGQFTSNHDLPRARNRMALSASDGGTTDRYAKIQGNLIDDSYNALFLYYGMIMALPGVTWIYYGDEIGMEGIMDYTLETGSTDSLTSSAHEDRIYRQPMKWEANTNTKFKIGFDKLECALSGINATSSLKSVAEQKADPNSLLNWVKTLSGIRKTYKLGQATAITGSGSGNKIEFTVTGGTGKKIKVTITSTAAAASGNHLA
ncbi:MAG: InlB B-repeat-containing protein, partial [Clostridiales bacterium]|nr:InlB B-repeat-containing protein [Clostridiales bacterium]